VWVGSVLIAAATSLPEVTTDIAAVRIGAPDLAAGDLFGSSMANMLILALVSLIPAGTELFRKAALEHALYASLAIILTVTAALFVIVRPTTEVVGIGVGPLLLAVVYGVGSRAVYRHSVLAHVAAATPEMSGVAVAQSSSAEVSGLQSAALPSLRRAVVKFGAAAVIILLAGPQFARSAEGVAAVTGIGTTFIGTWLVALTTSLPELVTSLAAVRIRAYDLAVGNLFGSNAFNMAIFVVLDPVHRGGAILSAVSPVHAVSALVAVALMSLALAALVYRAQGRLALLEPSSALIVVGYVLGLALILMQSTGG
jgi:cation:H+ antiporter